MQWPEAGTDPFPQRRQREPENLRNDILDELADHLALAAEDEMDKYGQTREGAWSRALERFGNPDAVARRLWWDAMKERIMRDWIQTGIAAVSAIVVLLMALFMVTSLRDMQATQTKLIEALNQISGRDQAPVGETLDIEVRRGTPDGPPATGVKVRIFGKLAPDSSADVSLETDAQGRVRFAPIPQGKYTLVLDDPQSTMTMHMEHSLFAGVGSKLQILAPDCTAVPIRFQVKPEPPFPNDRVVAAADFTAAWKAADFEWQKEGTVLVGRAGTYLTSGMVLGNREPGPSGSLNVIRSALEGPLPIVPLPALKIELQRIQSAFRILDSGFGVLKLREPKQRSQTIDLATNPEKTITLQLPEGDLRMAECVMKNYCVSERLTHIMRTTPNQIVNLDTDGTAIDGYLLAAVPLKDVAAVSVSPADNSKSILTVVDNRREENGTIWAGDTETRAVLRLPDAASLKKQYPADCRFLVSCLYETAECDLYRFTGTDWSAQVAATMPVDLEKPVHWKQEDNPLKQGPLVDVTDFVRGDAASAPVSGLLVQPVTPERPTPPPTPPSRPVALPPVRPRPASDEGVLLQTPDTSEQWLTPYLLVVRDTPPDDL